MIYCYFIAIFEGFVVAVGVVAVVVADVIVVAGAGGVAAIGPAIFGIVSNESQSVSRNLLPLQSSLAAGSINSLSRPTSLGTF